MKLKILKLMMILNLSLFINAKESRALFSKKELNEVKALKEADLSSKTIENMKKDMKKSAMYPFKMTRESELEEYKKFLKKLDGHYFDQIERTLLYKEMFEEFLESESL